MTEGGKKVCTAGGNSWQVHPWEPQGSQLGVDADPAVMQFVNGSSDAYLEDIVE